MIIYNDTVKMLNQLKYLRSAKKNERTWNHELETKLNNEEKPPKGEKARIRRQEQLRKMKQNSSKVQSR